MTKTEKLIKNSGLPESGQAVLMRLPENAPDGLGGSFPLRRMTYDIMMIGKQRPPSEETVELRAVGIIK